MAFRVVGHLLFFFFTNKKSNRNHYCGRSKSLERSNVLIQTTTNIANDPRLNLSNFVAEQFRKNLIRKSFRLAPSQNKKFRWTSTYKILALSVIWEQQKLHSCVNSYVRVINDTSMQVTDRNFLARVIVVIKESALIKIYHSTWWPLAHSLTNPGWRSRHLLIREFLSFILFSVSSLWVSAT